MTMAWLLAANLAEMTPGLLGIRGKLVEYTGLLGMTVMSVAMILALRPRLLEPLLGGIDKGYRLHKWLGITALVVSIIHWLWAVAPKWMVALGLFERGKRPSTGAELEPLAAWLRSQRGLAESVGEWAFYAAVVLILLALLKRVPYNRFFNVHRLFSLVYLGLVFHALILVPLGYWTQPVGLIMAALLCAGTASALLSLTGRIGAGRKHGGRIFGIEHYDNGQVMKLDVQLDSNWPGHQAGEFAFVSFQGSPESHPFSFASGWQDNSKISFLIKALGDHTGELVRHLRPTQEVTVEGPYGRFNFDVAASSQVWIAGGIGITPFIARMEQMAGSMLKDQEVHLFFCSKTQDPKLVDYVGRCAAEAGVKLHVLLEFRDGLLDADNLVRNVPGWQTSDYWFCGPRQFGNDLRQALLAKGIRGDDFHQELFEMR